MKTTLKQQQEFYKKTIKSLKNALYIDQDIFSVNKVSVELHNKYQFYTHYIHPANTILQNALIAAIILKRYKYDKDFIGANSLYGYIYKLDLVNQIKILLHI